MTALFIFPPDEDPCLSCGHYEGTCPCGCCADPAMFSREPSLSFPVPSGTTETPKAA